MGVSTSILFLDFKQLIKEILSLLLEIGLILLVIFLFGNLFEIIDRIGGNKVDYFLIAFFSGIAGSFSLFWPKIEQALVGVTISVALIPPLVLCGIALALGDMIY